MIELIGSTLGNYRITAKIGKSAEQRGSTRASPQTMLVQEK